MRTCEGMDDAARDARKRSWRYVEFSRTCAASFCVDESMEYVVRRGSRKQKRGRPGNTYSFGGAVLEEVEGARRSNDTSIAERRRKYECARVIN